MGKRKREREEEHLIRKIKRYEEKLRKKRKRRKTPARSSSLPSQITNRSCGSTSDDDVYLNEDEVLTPDPEETNLQDNIEGIVSNTVDDEITTVEQTQLTEPEDQQLGETNNLFTSDIPLEILDILGEAKKLDPTLGEKIPSEVAERWGKILLDGITKEQKDILREKMLVPENFTLVKAPKLNLEVASILSDAAKNRDKHLEYAQNQLGTGIAGLVNLTKDLIRAQSLDKLEVLKKISEISQILLDLHHEESLNRRKLIVPLLDKNFWNIIKGVKRDEFLFGSKLVDNIKNSKDIEKSSLQIKKTTLPSVGGHRRPNFQPGNGRGPPRRANNATAAPAANRYQPAPQTTSARRTNNAPSQRGRQSTINKGYDRRNRR